MTKPVNKNELVNAHRSKRLLDPAIEALKKIDLPTVGHDPYSLEKLNSFVAWLQKFEVKADAVISQAQSLHDNRPQHLINAALLRMSIIPPLIEGERGDIQRKTENHKAKIEELRRKGFTEAEIASILPDNQGELDTHNNAILDLKKEQKNIQDFLDGAPVYDVSLLNMEKLSSFMQNCKIAE